MWMRLKSKEWKKENTLITHSSHREQVWPIRRSWWEPRRKLAELVAKNWSDGIIMKVKTINNTIAVKVNTVAVKMNTVTQQQ